MTTPNAPHTGGRLRKGMLPRSPAREEGAAQSDGEEEVVERRNFLSRALNASASSDSLTARVASTMIAGAGEGTSESGGSHRNASGSRGCARGAGSSSSKYSLGGSSSGRAPMGPSYSDDDDDAAYVIHRPLVFEAIETFKVGRRRPNQGTPSQLALLGAERSRARRMAGQHDDDESEDDDDAEEEEDGSSPPLLPDGQKSLLAPGWGGSPPKRTKWWRARERTRKEEIKQKEESVAAEFEARRDALLQKSLALLKPLPRLSILSPLKKTPSRHSMGTPELDEAQQAAEAQAMQAALQAEASSSAEASASGLKPKTPARTGRKGVLDSRRRRYTHDGTMESKAAASSPSSFDADAAAVFRTAKAPATSGAPRRPEPHPELAQADLGKMYDFSRADFTKADYRRAEQGSEALPATYGRPLALGGSGSNVSMSKPAKDGLAASLGAQHTIARHAELNVLSGGTHLPMYGNSG